MYRKIRNVPIFKDIPPICPYFLGFRVGKYEIREGLILQFCDVFITLNSHVLKLKFLWGLTRKIHKSNHVYSMSLLLSWCVVIVIYTPYNE